MPSADIVVSTPVADSFRVASMRGMFDVSIEDKLTHKWSVNLPIEDFKWNVGLIVGSSGSGKTVIAKHLFPEENYHKGFKWDMNLSVIDHFPEAMQTKDITNLLSHVGFSSPPSWAKPFRVLSNGQKFRVELARILANSKDLIIVDEFTSVIDRNSAKVGSYAVSKTVKKRNKQIICLSCHRDIIEWLEPDWIYDTDSSEFKRGSLRRPQIKLDIFMAKKESWRIFREHHYLTASLAMTAQCFVAFFEGTPVAFTSYIHSVGFVGIKREHRTVVLPDFQGIGIGNKITEWLGDKILKKGLRFTSSLSHPALIHARMKTGRWKLRGLGHQRPNLKGRLATANKSGGRATARMEYVGKLTP